MNTRQKKIVTILIGSSLFLVWRVYAIVAKYYPDETQAGTMSAAPVESPFDTGTPVVEPIETKDTWQLQEELAFGPWGPDPFEGARGLTIDNQPDQTANPDSGEVKKDEPVTAPPPPPVRFTGASAVNGNWRAFVNDGIHRVGDDLDSDSKIVEITRRSMTVSYQGWNFRYVLGAAEPSVTPGADNP